jgi:hypothetical protein
MHPVHLIAAAQSQKFTPFTPLDKHLLKVKKIGGFLNLPSEGLRMPLEGCPLASHSLKDYNNRLSPQLKSLASDFGEVGRVAQIKRRPQE